MDRQGYQKIQDIDVSRRPSLSQMNIISPRHFDGVSMTEVSQLDIDMEVAAERMNICPPEAEANEEHAKYISLAVNASWAVNWFLLITKAMTYFMSSSKAVLAALVDSAVDLVSQGVLALAENYISKFSPDYPVGRSRLEALSVIACAFIMSTASLEGIIVVSIILPTICSIF